MMVIYLPVKFEFDCSKRFRVRVQKQKCLGRESGNGNVDRQTNGQKWTNKQMELH